MQGRVLGLYQISIEQLPTISVIHISEEICTGGEKHIIKLGSFGASDRRTLNREQFPRNRAGGQHWISALGGATISVDAIPVALVHTPVSYHPTPDDQLNE
jgi:hypothetical protein